MSPNKLVYAAGAGFAVAAICCFAPALIVLIGTIGLSAWLARVDYLPLPALAALMAVAAFGFYRLRRRRGHNTCGAPETLDRTRSGTPT